MNRINPNKKDKKNDNWTTPSWVWDALLPHIPKDKVIWEPFYNEGFSGEYLNSKGLNVIHNEGEDFFQHNKGDIIISNPPFTIKKDVLKRLKELDKPFMMLLPLDTIDRQYFQKIFRNDLEKISLYFLPRRIDFINKDTGYQPYRLSTVFVGYKVSDKPFIYLL